MNYNTHNSVTALAKYIIDPVITESTCALGDMLKLRTAWLMKINSIIVACYLNMATREIHSINRHVYALSP